MSGTIDWQFLRPDKRESERESEKGERDEKVTEAEGSTQQIRTFLQKLKHLGHFLPDFGQKIGNE